MYYYKYGYSHTYHFPLANITIIFYITKFFPKKDTKCLILLYIWYF